MKITFHEEARQDLLRALDYYEAQVDGLGYVFVEELVVALKQIQSQPQAYPIIRDNVRKCLLSRFQFHIYYRVLENRIRILVIGHQAQHPEIGKNRE